MEHTTAYRFVEAKMNTGISMYYVEEFQYDMWWMIPRTIDKDRVKAYQHFLILTGKEKHISADLSSIKITEKTVLESVNI